MENKNALDIFRQQKLQATEAHLLQTGNAKCSKCNYWMNKEFITNALCDECRVEAKIKWLD